MPTEPDQILSSEQIAEIEKRAKQVTAPATPSERLSSVLQISNFDVPALCKTMRALRAQLEESEAHNRVIRERLVIADGVYNAKGGYTLHAQTAINRATSELQSRLSEVEKERDRLREGGRQGRGIVRGWQEHIERMAKILKCEAMDLPVEQAAQRLVNFRTRVINLCKEKAAEWEAKRNALEPLSKMRNRYDAAFCAANEVATAIENLDHKGAL